MNEKVKMKTGEHIMKIILFQSTTDSLNTFAKLMAEGFKQAGYDILLTDMQNEQITRDEPLFRRSRYYLESFGHRLL